MLCAAVIFPPPSSKCQGWPFQAEPPLVSPDSRGLTSDLIFNPSVIDKIQKG